MIEKPALLVAKTLCCREAENPKILSSQHYSTSRSMQTSDVAAYEELRYRELEESDERSAHYVAPTG